MNPAARPGEPAGLLRRLAIMVYDALLLLAALFLAATVLVFLNHGNAIDTGNRLVALGVQGYYLAVAFLYYGWFWTRGQTLGMRAWRTELVDVHGEHITWRRAALRFVLAIVSWLPAGLGYLWSLVDRDRRTWHDLGAGTRLVVAGRAPSPSREPAHEPQADSEETERRA